MTKEEKIKEVMILVSAWGVEVSLTGEANLNASKTYASCDEVNYQKEAEQRMVEAKAAIESKLRELIQ